MSNLEANAGNLCPFLGEKVEVRTFDGQTATKVVCNSKSNIAGSLTKTRADNGKKVRACPYVGSTLSPEGCAEYHLTAVVD